MLHSLALLPHPPLLLRELSGETDVVPEVRAAVSAAAARAVAGTDAVLVVGGDDRTRPVDPDEWFDPGRYAPALRPRDRQAGPGTRPVSVEVAARALDEAGWAGLVIQATIGWQASRAEAEAVVAATDGDRRVALVVAGDGSARRSLKAPGHLDERAIEADGRIDSALIANDSGPLLALGDEEATDLWIPGRAALWVLALALDRRAWGHPEVHYLGDPFGVRYRALSWTEAEPNLTRA